MLVNDWSLRNLIPAELAKGFGFYQSKPSTAFSPCAVTPDELGDAWHDDKVHLPLVSHVNGQLFGQPEAGDDMTFDFSQIIAHVTTHAPTARGRHRRFGHGLQLRPVARLRLHRRKSAPWSRSSMASRSRRS